MDLGLLALGHALAANLDRRRGAARAEHALERRLHARFEARRVLALAGRARVGRRRAQCRKTRVFVTPIA